jgi:hypothetical protein
MRKKATLTRASQKSILATRTRTCEKHLTRSLHRYTELILLEAGSLAMETEVVSADGIELGALARCLPTLSELMNFGMSREVLLE